MNKTSSCLLAVLCILLCNTLVAKQSIRICTYNVLKYSQANEDGRTPMFKTVMAAIKADIVIVQEVEEASIGPHWTKNVLTHASFGFSPYIDGPDTDHMLFYNRSKFIFLSQRRIHTTLRDIAEFTLITPKKKGVVSDTIVVYSAHLKADESSTSTTARNVEVNELMKNLTTHSYTIICGDLNLYSPAEPAYVTLTSSKVKKFIDPMGSIWKRNSVDYAYMYTQCPRKTQIGACGGGVSGGMDDRFDFIFMSEKLYNIMIPNSYRPFGNDGLPRLNSSIDDPPNTAVSAKISAALKCASDHLPVIVDIALTPKKSRK